MTITEDLYFEKRVFEFYYEIYGREHILDGDPETARYLDHLLGKVQYVRG